MRSFLIPSAGIFVRALRLPFVSASVLPFIFGSLFAGHFRLNLFLLGLIAVAATHLSSNVMNDFADAKSGVDATDPAYYGFFGGSKLIQTGRLNAVWYRNAAWLFAAVAGLCIVAIAVIHSNALVVALYALVIVLGWMYSAQPLQFSYRRIGEAVIFLLFGPACVVGGWYIQTSAMPSGSAWLLSLPFGFLTAGILLANEVPDLPDDIAAGKMTLVSLVGRRRGWLLYAAAAGCAFLSIGIAVAAGAINAFALLSLIGIIPAACATMILRRFHDDKPAMMRSSRLAILAQAAVGIILILDVLL